MRSVSKFRLKIRWQLVVILQAEYSPTHAHTHKYTNTQIHKHSHTHSHACTHARRKREIERERERERKLTKASYEKQDTKWWSLSVSNTSEYLKQYTSVSFEIQTWSWLVRSVLCSPPSLSPRHKQIHSHTTLLALLSLQLHTPSVRQSHADAQSWPHYPPH